MAPQIVLELLQIIHLFEDSHLPVFPDLGLIILLAEIQKLATSLLVAGLE